MRQSRAGTVLETDSSGGATGSSGEGCQCAATIDASKLVNFREVSQRQKRLRVLGWPQELVDFRGRAKSPKWRGGLYRSSVGDTSSSPGLTESANFRQLTARIMCVWPPIFPEPSSTSSPKVRGQQLREFRD